MKLWLDDIREPWKFGCAGWTWAKTATEAIDHLKTGRGALALRFESALWQPYHEEIARARTSVTRGGE